jgi:hypothetical protein
VVTGIFTIVGVVVTAAAALLAAWIKYKTRTDVGFTVSGP